MKPKDHVVVLLSKCKSDPFVCQNSKKGKCACKVKESLKHEREKIESHWVPFLEKMQEEEEFKKTLLSDKVSDVKTEIEEHFDQIIVKITSRKEETIRNFEEEKQNATNAIDKTILEIKGNTRKLEDRKDEIRNILAREDEDLQKSMCMKIKEEKLTPYRMSYEVEDFCPGSLENNIVQQIFGKPPAIHETVQHNWYVQYGLTILRNLMTVTSIQFKQMLNVTIYT